MPHRLIKLLQQQTPSQTTWRKVLLCSILLLLLLAGYLLLAEYFGSFVASYSGQLWLEALLVLYLYGLVYIVLRPSRWRVYLAAVPLLLIYLTSDVFYLAFGKVFRLVNLLELPELLEVLPLSYSMPLSILVLLPVIVLLVHIMWRPGRHVLLVATPLLATVLLLFSIPGAVAQMLEGASQLVKYSDAKSVENNGRLTMMLYREAQRLKTLEDLAPYRDRDNYERRINEQLQALQPSLDKRNIHLIVLESFLDPRLFSKLSFSSSPELEQGIECAKRLLSQRVAERGPNSDCADDYDFCASPQAIAVAFDSSRQGGVLCRVAFP